SELLDEDSEPDDDFYMTGGGTRTGSTVPRSLYLVMSNATAVSQLLSLFQQWKDHPNVTFQRGLNRFKVAFAQLRAIRRWGAEDRVRDTGLLDAWRERLAVVGQSVSTLPVEVELWYRQSAEQRAAAESHLRSLIQTAGGTVLSRAEIGEIAYHALLADIPVQQVTTVMGDGAGAIDLLNADEIMFVSPYTPMSVPAPGVEPTSTSRIAPVERIRGLPRIALLDGLPFANHDTLAGRLTIDDPDGLAGTYPVGSRHHGTTMASLIIHGDLSNPGEPLDRPIYVRPILEPHPFLADEVVLHGQLLTDLLHRAVRRIVEGDGSQPASAPSIRVVNLSIGAESRALVRRMSPLGRLLDWLAVKYNLLFVVSAGNHLTTPITIPADAAQDVNKARVEAVKAVRSTARLRGILPPGDAVNALTVGAVHADEAGDQPLPDTVWDLVWPGAPALYGAVGPGVGRSIKPDLYHAGGRALYQKPVIPRGATEVQLGIAQTRRTGPGSKVAAPRASGATDAALYTHGTSNAAALVTREASRIFDVLEAGRDSGGDFGFPDPLYHPVLAKALLVHASSWGKQGKRLRSILALDSARARRELTAILGYGSLRPDRIGSAATNRAVLVAGGSIGRDQRHTYHVPLPGSLRSKAEWHRFTVTLAYFAPTLGRLTRYRSAKVFFEKLDDNVTRGSRIDAEHNATRRGSVQHEVVDGSHAMVFNNGDSLPIHVGCMDDAQRLRAGETIRYGLVISVETLVTTSASVHDEIRAQLQDRAREQARPRIQS
ncbi:MAG TPA: S8 family peptidase, partial [Pseudonocardiaceae bacterium]|nr:S8 family peptidase [Pseudonocardiaceae bacterium]